MYSTGAVIAQDYDGFEYPVHYISKTITKAQQHKHSYFSKTLALHNALTSFNHYLQRVTFYVCTDCHALAHWNTTKKIQDKVKRWLSLIQYHDIIFIHCPGEQLVTQLTSSL